MYKDGCFLSLVNIWLYSFMRAIDSSMVLIGKDGCLVFS